MLFLFKYLPLSAFLVSTLTLADNLTLKLCEDDADYAPFIYREKDSQNQSTGQFAGSTVELVRKLSLALKIPMKIELYPIKRCMKYIEDGQFDIGMDFYLDPERAQKFDYSPPYYTLTAQYYFNTKLQPEGLNIQSAADLKKYQGCGLSGYSYEHYGLKEGAKFEVGARNHAIVLQKLMIGRCDYFVEEMEVIDGYTLVGDYRFAQNPNLGHAPVPGVKAPSLYFIYSKKSPKTAAFKLKIDQEIAKISRESR